MDLDDMPVGIFSLVAPHLTERQRRPPFGAAARAVGSGGVSRVARLAAASQPTVRRGAVELDQPADPRDASANTRAPSGYETATRACWRCWTGWSSPTPAAIRRAHCAGPASPPGELAQALTAAGHPISDDTVGRLLKQQGCRLQRTAKTLEDAQHPDLDAQFRYLNEQARTHLAAGSRWSVWTPRRTN